MQVYSFPICVVAFSKCNLNLLTTKNECNAKQKYSKGTKEAEIRPTNEYYLNSVEQNISLFADIDLMSISNTVNGIIAKIVSGTKATEAIWEQANINVAESYSNIGNPQERLADLVFSNSLVESANRDVENGRYITGTIKGLIATTQTALIFTGLGESVSGIRTAAGTSGYNTLATKATTAIAKNITTKEITSTVGKVETITDTSRYLGKEIGEKQLSVRGATFEGTIYRNVESKYNPLEIDAHNIDTPYRYSPEGIPGLYFSSSERIVKAELANYDAFDFINRTAYSYNAKLTNMLDVTNP